MQDKGTDMTRMLAENEAAISRLYCAYAERFASHNSFWLQLASDEANHAAWIRKLEAAIEGNALYLAENRFQLRPIEIMQDYINKQLTRTQEEKVTLMDALSTALDIEQSLLERNYFEVFETDSVETKHLLLDLKSATQKHLQQVRKAWEAAKSLPAS